MRRLRKFSEQGRYSTDVVFAVLCEEKPNQKEQVLFMEDDIRKYFPKSYTKSDMLKTIISLLKKWQRPMAYWHSKGLNRGGKKTQTNPYKWCKTTIQKILSQPEYCGDIINFKTYSNSFKNKRRYQNDKENRAVFKNANEPIIDREVFDRVREITSKTKRRAPKKENGERSIFNGLIYCGDCHSKMRYHTNTINKDIHYFTCPNKKVDYRGNCPGRHYVREIGRAHV